MRTCPRIPLLGDDVNGILWRFVAFFSEVDGVSPLFTAFMEDQSGFKSRFPLQLAARSLCLRLAGGSRRILPLTVAARWFRWDPTGRSAQVG